MCRVARRSQSRSFAAAMSPRILLLLSSCLLAVSLVSAAQSYGLTEPTARSTAYGFVTSADLCPTTTIGNGTSTMFTGTPSNMVETYYVGTLTPATSFVILTLYKYQQIGVSTAGGTSTALYNQLSATQLSNKSITLTGNTPLIDTTNIELDSAFDGCGQTATSDPTHTQTRCVLRYLYAYVPAGTSGWASCADVIIYSRDSDVDFAITVSLPTGSTAIQSQTALNRLFGSTWAGLSTTGVHSFYTSTSSTNLVSNQIRLADNAIVVGSSSYTINFILSATSTMTASQLAASLRSQDLSTMFGVTVTSTSYTGAASANAASALLTIVAMGAAWIMQRAASA